MILRPRARSGAGGPGRSWVRQVARAARGAPAERTSPDARRRRGHEKPEAGASDEGRPPGERAWTPDPARRSA